MKSKSKPPIKITTSNNNDKVNINNRPPLPYRNLTTSVPELLCIFCSKDNNQLLHFSVFINSNISLTLEVKLT